MKIAITFIALALALLWTAENYPEPKALDVWPVVVEAVVEEKEELVEEQVDLRIWTGEPWQVLCGEQHFTKVWPTPKKD